jgi:hypothetical protein
MFAKEGIAMLLFTVGVIVLGLLIGIIAPRLGWFLR